MKRLQSCIAFQNNYQLLDESEQNIMICQWRATSYLHRHRRNRLLTCYVALLRTRVNNGDSKWRFNRAKTQVTTMGKTFVGACFGKQILRINRNRHYIPE